MKRTIRAGVAALAFAGLVAQPIAANAGAGWYCPKEVVPSAPSAFPLFWGIGFIICAGLTVGKDDTDAAKAGTTVSGKKRFAGFLGCVLPPIGFHKLGHGA
jgi:hypothetical protein